MNFVTHAEDSSRTGLVARAVAGFWPVAWAVRRAFDECKTFKSAAKFLKSQYLLAPVLLTVVGTKNSERVVIECGCEDYWIREPEGTEPLLTTNHYALDETSDWNADDLDDSDSCDRFESLEALLHGEDVTAARALRVLSDDHVMRSDTQHQVVMQPATGKLVVRVPGRPILNLTLEA